MVRGIAQSQTAHGAALVFTGRRDLVLFLHA